MKAIHVIKRFYGPPLTSISFGGGKNATKLQVRQSTSLGSSRSKIFGPAAVKVRHLGLGPTSKDFEEPAQITGPLTKVHATELVLHLNNDERKMLLTALQEFESNKIKEEFEGKQSYLSWIMYFCFLII